MKSLANQMRVTAEKIEDSRVLLNIEVEREPVDRSLEQAYRRIVNRINVPGFRKGKAPRYIVERLVGQDTLMQEGLELLWPEVYRQAVAESGIKPIDQPEWDIVQLEPLVLKATVPVQPTVQLGDYHQIRLSRERVEVSAQQVESALAQVREEHSEWLPVQRPVATGDRLNITALGRISGATLLYADSGEPLLETERGEVFLDDKDVEHVVQPEPSRPLPGFAEALVGMKRGEMKQFRLTLPPDLPRADLAAREAVFQVTVHEIKEKHLPELNDGFAKSIGEYESLEALKEDVRRSLQRRAEYEAERRLEEAVLERVVDQATVEMPTILIEREIDGLWQDFKERLEREHMALPQYLANVGKNEADLREELQPVAKRRLKTFFVIDQIAKEEKIEVEPGEVDETIERVAGVFKDEPRIRASLDTAESKKELGVDLRYRKTLHRLVQIATSGETPDAENAAERVTPEGDPDQPQD
ncbi:MAG: trigger factor [Chloroflexi bacterium]|nr:trigger factor [Chloroflexota bacterium]MCL5076049.1 trigger factor [Chloroflexota bacterium]